MQKSGSPSACVVVGIDGSRAAVDAALWAVDEATSRDIPLRLVYAIDPPDSAGAVGRDEAREVATANAAVRYAFSAVQSTRKPVKIEVAISQSRPQRAVLDASQSAAMICVGAQGLKHTTQGRIGSTAAALAGSAHCPVAIIRGYDPNRRPGWIVVEVNGSSASSGVLQRGFDEARLRGAPLRVLATWRDSHAVADGNRLTQAQLNRRLTAWRKRCPGIDVQVVAVHGNTLDYLASNAASIQLVVVGHERVGGIGDLLGPPGYAAMHNSGCVVLVCEPQHPL